MKFLAAGLLLPFLFVAILAASVAALVSTPFGLGQTDEGDTSDGGASAGVYASPVGAIGDGDIVRVRGIQVHRSIAGNVEALLAAAGRDGLPLDAWGYRPTSRQIELRIQNCGGNNNYAIYQKPSGTCSPPTATPGRSQHEKGLALDFKNCSSRTTACYRWLRSNAALFGLINLPSEPWHWSTTGR